MRIASSGCNRPLLSKEVHFPPQVKYLHAQLTGYGLQLLRIIKVRNPISEIPVGNIELREEAPFVREAAIGRQRRVCCGERHGIRPGIDEKFLAVF